MMITDSATGLPQVASGKLRGLGFTGSERSPLAPELLTIAEAGVPGYEMGYWFGAYVPAGTPDAVVAKLNDLLITATKGKADRHFYEINGTVPATSTPHVLAEFHRTASHKSGDNINKA